MRGRNVLSNGDVFMGLLFELGAVVALYAVSLGELHLPFHRLAGRRNHPDGGAFALMAIVCMTWEWVWGERR
jgi:hypothetical protein